ncbi:MAG: peptide chain release factor 2 [Chloroflexi bacterium]|nr:peptide chain release factor 2 [Chloroflexota bacterium]|tara:strand:+ start:10988 stop:12022 length:1035 start_codon:yes stop_codon:yes gene_type:complete
MEIDTLEKKTLSENFWNDRNKAQIFMKTLSSKKDEYNKWKDIVSKSENLVEFSKLIKSENDSSLNNTAYEEYADLLSNVKSLEFELQLNGEFDVRSAIVTITQGAGGVDAQDWAEMLLRMYIRWAEKKNFTVETLDFSPGDEAGIKTAVIKINGRYSYGYLRSEKGVHRLVRLSPYDTDHKRHTSFASVEILPEPDEAEEIKVNTDEIKIDVFRASGNGGQSVQKNSTAVRITHIPTGIVVSVQNERSQAQNKEIAMKILTAKLTDLEIKKISDKQAKLKGEHISAEFGRQVRSYIQHPYQMVKDHRTNYQTNKTNEILDGEIDSLLKSYLTNQIENHSNSILD